MFWKWDSFHVLFGEAINIWRNRGSLFRFELFMKGVVGLLLVPLISFTFTRSMTAMGWRAVSNNEWIAFILNPGGGILICILSLISVLTILLELGGLICIAHLSQEKRLIDLQSVTIKALRRFPRMLGPGGLLLTFYFLLVAPLLELGSTTSLLQELHVPEFIEDHIFTSGILSVVYVLALFAFGALAFYMSFSLHFLFFENMKPMRAIRESFHLVHRHFLRLLRFWAGFTFLSILLIGPLSILGVLLSEAILDYASQWTLGGQLLVSLWFAVVLIGSLLVTVVSAPYSVYVHTALFKRLRYVDGHGQLDLAVRMRGWECFRFRALLGKRRLWQFGGVLLFCGILLMVFVMVAFVPLESHNVQITAHRGSSIKAPENTMAALRQAIADGADWAEIDVQQTADGEVVLLHDATLARTTGEDRVLLDVPLSHIQTLDAGSWFDASFSGETVPTLEQAIRLTAGQIKLNIEVKGNEETAYLIPEVVRLIEAYDLYDRCIVTSLNLSLLEEVHRLDERVRTGYIIVIAAGDLESLPVQVISMEASRITERLVHELHSAGKEVHAWTVNDTADLEELRQMGIDNVITDYPDIMVDYLVEWDGKSRLEKLMDILLTGEW